MNEDINTALHRLGLCENTQPYHAVKAAVFVAMQEPGSLLMATKWLYPEAAKVCGGSRQALEKNLRTAVANVWGTHRQALQALSAVSLEKKPTASQFVALLASELRANAAT